MGRTKKKGRSDKGVRQNPAETLTEKAAILQEEHPQSCGLRMQKKNEQSKEKRGEVISLNNKKIYPERRSKTWVQAAAGAEKETRGINFVRMSYGSKTGERMVSRSTKGKYGPARGGRHGSG